MWSDEQYCAYQENNEVLYKDTFLHYHFKEPGYSYYTTHKPFCVTFERPN